MNDAHKDDTWRLDKKINWSIRLLVTVVFCFLAGILAPMKIHGFDLGKNWFWIALGSAFIIAVIINLLRPKYENAHGFWKSFYAFLLKQMPPPD